MFHAFFEIDDIAHFPQAYVSGDPVFKGIYEDNDPAQAADGHHQLQHRRVAVSGSGQAAASGPSIRPTRRTSSA